MKLWSCYEATKRSSGKFATSQINREHNRCKTSGAPANYPAWNNFVAKPRVLQVAFIPPRSAEPETQIQTSQLLPIRVMISNPTLTLFDEVQVWVLNGAALPSWIFYLLNARGEKSAAHLARHRKRTLSNDTQARDSRVYRTQPNVPVVWEGSEAHWNHWEPLRWLRLVFRSAP